MNFLIILEEPKEEILRIQGKTIKLDPNLFPEDLEPELFKIHEDENTLFFALYSTKAIKIFRLNKEAPESLPELILTKTARKIIFVEYPENSMANKSQARSSQEDQKVFLISRGSGTQKFKDTNVYSDFFLSEEEASNLPQVMKPYVALRSSPKTPKHPTYSIRVRLGSRNRDLEKSYFSKSFIEEQTYEDLLIKEKNKSRDLDRILFALEGKNWIKSHLIKYEKFLTKKSKISRKDFETMYNKELGICLKIGLKWTQVSYFRLSAPEECLRLVEGNRLHETVHMAALFETGTRLLLNTINLRLKKVIRAQVVNVAPDFEITNDVSLSRYRIVGFIWDAEKDRAVVSILELEANNTRFYRIEGLTNLSKRTSELLHEVTVGPVSLNGSTWCKNFIDYVPEYEKKVDEGFKDSLEIDPETGKTRRSVLFTEAFEPFIRRVLLKTVKSKIGEQIKASVPLRDAGGQKLALLASEK